MVPPQLAAVLDEVHALVGSDDPLEIRQPQQRTRHAGARQRAHDGEPVRLESGLPAAVERRRGRQRVQQRQVAPQRGHDPDARVGIGESGVDMHAADDQAPHAFLERQGELLIALLRRGHLRLPLRKRMGRGGPLARRRAQLPRRLRGAGSRATPGAPPQWCGRPACWSRSGSAETRRRPCAARGFARTSRRCRDSGPRAGRASRGRRERTLPRCRAVTSSSDSLMARASRCLPADDGHAPGALAGRHRGDDRHRIGVDHAYVVGRAVGRI